MNLHRVVRPVSFTIGILLSLTGAVFADGAQYSEEHLRAELVADTRLLQSSSTLRVGVEFVLEPGWHIYAKNPGDVGLPTEVVWSLPAGASAGEVVYPAAKEFRHDDEVSFGFEERALLFSDVTLTSAEPAAELPVTASLSWVLCKDECIPGSATLTTRVAVAGGVTNPDVAKRFDEVLNATAAERGVVRAEPDSLTGFLLIALGAFAGGVILNLMPCVLPVVSLKILGLVEDAPAHERRMHGFLYTLGVLASFLSLATLLAVIRWVGGEVGWGFQFQSPQFVVGMLFLVFLLGLNLAGVFEVGATLQRAAGQVRTSDGAVGAFLTGVLATALATPCTAPFMGSAIAASLSMPLPMTLTVFAALGMGMALPYLVLCLCPFYIRFLPKPGTWMESLKQALAFPMFVTAVWLLWVLGNQQGVDAVAAAGFGLVLLGLAAWVVGRWGTPVCSKRSRRLAFSVATVAVAGAVIAGMPGVLRVQEVDAVMEDRRSDVGIPWVPYSDEVLRRLTAERKPVLLDFTAAWCLVCQVNEKRVLRSHEIVELVARTGIVPVRADWTRPDPTIKRLLDSYGQSGVPLVVVQDSDGKARQFPSLLSASELAGELRRVSAGGTVSRGVDMASLDSGKSLH